MKNISNKALLVILALCAVAYAITLQVTGQSQVAERFIEWSAGVVCGWLGGALLYAIGRYLGWYVAGAIVVAAVGYFAWTVVRVMSQLPTIWRLW